MRRRSTLTVRALYRPKCQLVDAAGGQESEACDLGAEGRQATPVRVLDPALDDDVVELPVEPPRWFREDTAGFSPSGSRVGKDSAVPEARTTS
jgi:hypothetical protein